MGGRKLLSADYWDVTQGVLLLLKHWGLTPEDVFDVVELERWAIQAGWQKGNPNEAGDRKQERGTGLRDETGAD